METHPSSKKGAKTVKYFIVITIKARELDFGIKFGQEKSRISRNKKEWKSLTLLIRKKAHWAEKISHQDEVDEKEPNSGKTCTS